MVKNCNFTLVTSVHVLVPVNSASGDLMMAIVCVGTHQYYTPHQGAQASVKVTKLIQ